MIVSLIVAVSENGVIGKDNEKRDKRDTGAGIYNYS